MIAAAVTHAAVLAVATDAVAAAAVAAAAAAAAEILFVLPPWSTTSMEAYWVEKLTR